MRSALLCLLAAPFVVAAPVPKGIKIKSDLELLEGRWEVVSLDRGKGPQDEPEGEPRWYLVVSQDRITTGKGAMIGHDKRPFKLDPTQSPKHLDLEGRDGRVTPGIYLLTGDTLTWCTHPDHPRPTEFVAGANGCCIVYKRVKDK